MATLLMITVVTGAAVAFFQSTRIERYLTRNYADLARGQMTAKGGYALATALLRAATTNDDFIVVLNSQRQLFIGNGTNQPFSLGAGQTFAYLPLFSHSTNLTNYSLTGTNGLVLTNSNPLRSISGAQFTLTNYLPGGTAVTSPALTWVTLTNATGRTNARFAFWVEDLSGRLDLSVSGGTGINASRPSGTNPAELALWSLFNPSVTNDLSNAVVLALTNARSALFTPASSRLVTNAVTTNLMADLVAGLVHDTNEPQIIPFGFGYTNQGQAKLNLNRIITNPPATAANLIASHISTNLVNFSNRAGGFPSGAYLTALSANLLDYVDNNSQPTFVATNPNLGATTNVRGIEALPFVNERTTLFNLIQTNQTNMGGVNGTMLTLITQDFYEFWNPASRPTPATGVTVVASNNQLITLGFANLNLNAPTSATNSLGQGVTQGLTTNSFNLPSLQPNEFYVSNSLAVTNYFFVPGNNPPSFPGTYNGNRNFLRYQVYLGDVNLANLYDQTILGCWLAANANLQPNINDNTPGNRRFFGSYSAFSAQTPLGTFRTTTGDPRIMFYLNDNQDQVTYGNGSSFGGRNVRGNISVNNNYYQVSLPLWPDSGHNGPAGTNGGTALPATGRGANYTNLSPGRISDAGSFSNICELGAIYDPIQWRDPTFRQTAGYGSEPNGGQWNLLTINATADNRFGGGNSLRIGRAEHPRFNTNGLRAAQLLDLFAVDSAANPNAPLNRVPGRINLNTATTNTLRALSAGVLHVQNPALLPGGTNFTVPLSAVSNFIAGVTNFRAARPFYSPAELAQITNGSGTYPSNAVFGNTNTIGLSVTAWNDASAEEWFAKIHPLATVRSRNFLIHVVGQTMSTNTNFLSRPIATSRQMFQVYAAPDRNAAGFTTNTTIQLVRSWNLP